jgi:hypothetical protein
MLSFFPFLSCLISSSQHVVRTPPGCPLLVPTPSVGLLPSSRSLSPLCFASLPQPAALRSIESDPDSSPLEDNTPDSKHKFIANSKSLLHIDSSEPSEDENEPPDHSYIGSRPFDHMFVSFPESESSGVVVREEAPLRSSRSGWFDHLSTTILQPHERVSPSIPDPIESIVRWPYEEFDRYAGRCSHSWHDSLNDRGPLEAALESGSTLESHLLSMREFFPLDAVPFETTNAVDLSIFLCGFSLGGELGLTNNPPRSHSVSPEIDLVNVVRVLLPCSQVLAVRELRSPGRFSGIPSRAVTTIERAHSFHFRSNFEFSYGVIFRGTMSSLQRAFTIEPDHAHSKPLVESSSKGLPWRSQRSEKLCRVELEGVEWSS